MTKSAAIAAAVCLLAGAARAAEPPTDGWGSPGTVLVQGAFVVQNQSYDAPGSSAVTALGLTPSVQAFVAGPVVLGAALSLLYSTSNGASLTTFGLQPSVGVNLDLAPTVALLPQLNFTFSVLSVSGGSGSLGSASANHFALGGYLPLIAHPVAHFYVGIGPYFSVDLATAGDGSPAKQTTLGAQTVLGAFF
jgi:hypothetical protein